MAITGDEFIIPVKGKDNVTGPLRKMEKAVKSISGKFGQAQVVINQSLELMGKAARTAQAAFDGTVGKAIALEKGIAEVATLLGNDAAEATAKLTKDVLSLQSQFGTDQADLTKAFYQAISSGAVDASNATGLLNTAQKLAVGGVTTLSTATDGLTNIMNAYGVGAEEAASVSDALFIGMKAGKTTVGELSNNLGKAASLAANTNVPFQELIASVSAITTGGVETSQAITQVRAAMVALNRQSGGLSDAMKSLNIESIQAKVSQDGLVGTLKEIVATTDGSSEALTQLFGEVEAVSAVMALTSDTIGNKFIGIMDDMADSAENAGDATEQAFSKIAATTDFQLNQALGNLTANFTRVGQVLKPAFTAIVEGFNAVINGISAGVEAINRAFDSVDFDAFINKAGVLTDALKGVAAGLLIIFGPQILAGATALASAFVALVAPAALLAIKVGAIAAAFVGVLSVIDIAMRNIELLENIALSVFNQILQAMQQVKLFGMTMFEPLVSVGGRMIDVVIDNINLLGEGWNVVANLITMSIQGIIKLGAVMFKPILKGLNLIGKVSDKELAAFEKGVDGVSDSVESLVPKFKKFGGVANKISESFSDSMQDTANQIVITENRVNDLSSSIDKGIKNIDLGFLGEGIKQVGNFMDGLAGPTQTVVNGVKDVGNKAKEAAEKAKQMATELKKAASVQFAKQKKSLAEFNASLGDAVKGAKIAVLGTDFEQLTFQIQQAKKAQDESRAAFLKGGPEASAQLDKLKAATLSLVDGEAQLKALRSSSFDQLQAQTEQASIAQLNASGQYVAAVEAQNAAALTAFDEETARLKEVFKLREDELALIDETRAALVAKGQADVQSAVDKEGKAAAKGRKAEDKGPQAAGQLFSNADADQISLAFGAGAGEAATAVSGALAGFTGPIAAANVVADAVQGLIDAIPQLLSKIANIFNSLTELPQMIVLGLEEVILSIGNFLSNFIPKLAEALPAIIKQIFTELPAVIVEGTMALLNALPLIIDGLIDVIPELILGLAKGAGKLASGLVNFLIKDAPKIAIALTKALLIDLPVALAKGITKALLNLTGEIFPTEQIQNGIKEVGKSISRSTSQLFKVIDLEQQGRGLDVADRIRNAISSSSDDLVGKVKRAFTLKDFIKDIAAAVLVWTLGVKAAGFAWKAVQYVAGAIWEGLVIAGGVIWEAIQKVAGALWNTLVTAGAAIWEAIQPIAGALWEAIVVASAAIWELIQPVAGALWEAFVVAGGVIWEAIQTVAGGVFNALVTVGAGIWKAVQKVAGGIWKALVTVGGAIWEAVQPVAGAAWNALVTAGGAIWEAVQPVAGALWDAIVVAGGTAWTAVQAVAGAAWELVVTTAGAAWTAVQVVAGAAWELVVVTTNALWVAAQLTAGAAWEAAVLASGLVWDLLVVGGAAIWAALVLATSTTAGILLTGGLTVLLAALVAFFSDENNVKMFEDAGNQFGKDISQGFKDGVKWFEDFLLTFKNALVDAIAGFGPAFKNAVDAFAPALGAALTTIGEGIARPFTDAFDQISNFFADLKFPEIKTPEWLDKFIKYVKKLTGGIKFDTGGFVGGAKKLGGKIASGAKKAGGAISSGAKKAGGAISSGFKKLKGYFNKGGSVGPTGRIDVPSGKTINGVLHAQDGALANLGTDTVSAKLTPGEFVVNREATRNNLGLLSFINDAKKPIQPVQGEQNFSIVVNAKTNLTADQIRREVIPEMEKQLRRKSQQGRFVIDGAGIRNS